MELIDKLRLKKDKPLLLVHSVPAPTGLFADFAAAPETGTVTQALLFVTTTEEMAINAPPAIARLAEGGLLWIMYPKKTSKIPTDLGRDKGWEVVYNMGYEPVTSAAIDADWTALRLKKKEAISGYIRAIPIEERQAEGIDFKTRTVTLPADAQQAVAAHEGMAAYFDQLAFTHKKEHVMAIVDAKRPETRVTRIAKMVAMLQQGMAAQTVKKNKK